MAATFSATRRPWRIACWQVGGLGARRCLAGSGTAAASPIAQTFVVPATRIVASTSMRPPWSSGRPSLRTTGAGVTPAVQHSSRAGMRSPVDSVTEPASAESSIVPVRISIPRARSSRVANSARLAGISGITRSRASTRTKRVPIMRQRG